jgi:hypothetical protein
VLGCGKTRSDGETDISGILRALFIVLAAGVAAISGSAELSAQTRPEVTTLGPGEPTARFLQNVAWETVQEYYQK